MGDAARHRGANQRADIARVLHAVEDKDEGREGRREGGREGGARDDGQDTLEMEKREALSIKGRGFLPSPLHSLPPSLPPSFLPPEG
jgi:hypothetical protein